MASLSDFDDEFSKAQQAALNRDDDGLNVYKPRMKIVLGHCSDLPDWEERNKLEDAAHKHLQYLRHNHASQGDVISTKELMQRHGIRSKHGS